jgi:hypothetical protein
MGKNIKDIWTEKQKKGVSHEIDRKTPTRETDTKMRVGEIKKEKLWE